MRGGDEILRIEGLCVYFYTYAGVVRAVEDLNLTIYRGETFALVGETGCGKSVTMRAVLRLVPPPGRIVKGRIIFDGVDLLKLPEKEMRKIRGSKISMVFQDPNTALDPLYTAGYQTTETILAHRKVSKKSAWQRALELFKVVEIPEPKRRLRAYPHELSGGMKQRVVTSIALSLNPKLLIADEPTTALDVTIQAQILELLRDLQRKYGVTLVMITHNMGVVADMADRVAVMYAGSVVEVADVYELFGNPLHPYTKGLLRAIPSLTSRNERLQSIPGTVPNMIRPPPGCKFHPRCEYAMDVCKRERPRMIDMGKGHLVACHLYS
ncbi:MAG: ABC transporter ATP-binding protein [Thermoprotei archaeon]|nr:ABC transporter ATP-binding protein [Thermoprotei archaeon]